MPIHRIEVSEYECSHCGYKWVNRVNGKDGPVPKKCAKCKRPYWNTGQPNQSAMSPEENGLRRRVEGLRELYPSHLRHYSHDKGEYTIDESDYVASKWPEDLAQKFLGLQPSPTVEELKRVVYPRGLSLEPLDSQNQYRLRGYVPDPDKPGWLKYDSNGIEYVKLRKQEALRRIEAMQQVIQSRQGQGQEQEQEAIPVQKEAKWNGHTSR